MGLKALTAAQVAQFAADGYYMIPAFLTPDELVRIRNIYTQALTDARAGRLSTILVQDATAWDGDRVDTGRPVLRKVPAPFDRHASFRAIFSSRHVLDHVEDLIGPEIYLHSSKLIFKHAHGGRRKPLHQDLAYWSDMTARQVTLWCAIDRATPESGCLELIPGSHLHPLRPHEDLDDWQIPEHSLNLASVRHAVMDPGDAIFLDVLTIHASGQNHSDHDRLAAVVNFYSRPRDCSQVSRYGSMTPLRSARLGIA